jgi:photosystem II stability/assembly factor-like uncharacterized protein
MKTLNLLNNKILVILFILTSFHCKAQWNAVYELDSTVFLGMHFTSDSVGYVVGYRINAQNYNIGQILKTTDGGNHWSKIYESTPTTPNPASHPLYHCVYFPTESIGYVGADQSIILKTTDTGQTWINQFVPEFSFDTRMINCIDSLTCFAGKALMFKTFDGGLNWVVDSNASPTEDVSFLSPNKGYGLWSKTFDGGHNWTNPSSYPAGLTPDYNCIFFINDSVGWLGGMGSGGSPHFNYGKIAKSTNYGFTYQETNFQFEMLAIRDLFFINDTVGFACGNGQSGNSRQIMKTIDGGLNWHKQFLNYTTNYSAVTQLQCLNDSLCYAISGWQVFKTTNGGGQMIGLGESESAIQNKIKIYPNPASDKLYIEQSCANCLIVIYSGQGQEVSKYSKIDKYGTDISQLGTGFYIYSITDRQNGTTSSGKFIKE